jgi:hypothetical protein
MSLYYLLSSLPLLSFDAAPPISEDAFLGACQAQLDRRDAEAASALLCGLPSPHPFVCAWRDKETILRNAAARERARVAGSDATRWLRPAGGCDTYLESLVEDAFQEADPLRREKTLDRARWAAAEELQGPDPLTVRVALAYAIKLAILLRWSLRRADRGREAFDTLTAAPVSLGEPAGH